MPSVSAVNVKQSIKENNCSNNSEYSVRDESNAVQTINMQSSNNDDIRKTKESDHFVEQDEITAPVGENMNKMEIEVAKWSVGDIVWSKTKAEEWWPAILVNDPKSNLHMATTNDHSQDCTSLSSFVYLRYLGPVLNYGWTQGELLIPYASADQYRSLPGNLVNIPINEMESLLLAVEQATAALVLPKEERLIQVFNKSISTSTSNRECREEAMNGRSKLMKTELNNADEVCVSKDDEVMKGNEVNVDCSADMTDKSRGINLKRSSRKRRISSKLREHILDGNIQSQKKRKVYVCHEKDAVAVSHSVSLPDCTSDSSCNLDNMKDSYTPASSVCEQDKSVASEEVELSCKEASKNKSLNKNTKKVKNNVAKEVVKSEQRQQQSKSKQKNRELSGSKGICTLCEKLGNNLITCQGGCLCRYHLQCVGLQRWPTASFRCQDCIVGIKRCFVCKDHEQSATRCKIAGCGKSYHGACLSHYTCSHVTEDMCITCPRHVCTTCTAYAISKNEDSIDTSDRKKLARCIYCPVAYHASECCLPAGCVVLAPSAIICNKHLKEGKAKHVNVDWCFACSRGGNLICCELCPASYHEDCLNENVRPKLNEDRWICRSCIDGNFPICGDIVWAKIGAYRWWPAEVYNTKNIPGNILALKHSNGEFPIQFLGSHDYSWMSISRVFAYEEEDIGGKTNKLGRKGLLQSFTKALKEAEQKFTKRKLSKEKKEAKSQEKRSQKPPQYKHIKTNKVVDAVIKPNLSEYTPCFCKPTDENPCGSNSNCINRMLLCECNPTTCPTGEKCLNQRFQKQDYAKTEIFKTDVCGWGLKALTPIKVGTLVVEYVGELISEKTYHRRIKAAQSQGEKNFYYLNIDKDVIIDARWKSNVARFMNHSCEPNCETHKWTVNGLTCIGLIAIKDIEKGEELTFDYRLHAIGNEQAECRCGSKHCREFLGAKIRNANTAKEKGSRDSKSIKNSNGQEKRKKKRKRKHAAKHEDECFVCGDGGQLIMCSKKNCYKCYHLGCLTIDGIPRGKWDCPWHHCDVCGKPASRLCSRCPNSFCQAHADTRIQPVKVTTEANEVLICQECVQDDKETNQQLQDSTVDGTACSNTIQDKPES